MKEIVIGFLGCGNVGGGVWELLQGFAPEISHRDHVKIRVKKTDLERKLLDYELVETGLEERIYDRMDYEKGRGTSFVKGEDGSFDNITVGINKVARKEKIRKAIKESKRKSARKSGKTRK